MQPREADRQAPMARKLLTRRNQAFFGATSVAYPLLGGDYVEHLLNRLARDGLDRLTSAGAAAQAFATLGNRPKEMLKALRHLR